MKITSSSRFLGYRIRDSHMHVQLFRERLSYKRGNAYATMSKVIMGNGGFAVAWLKLKVFQSDGRKQHKQAYSCFLLPTC